MADAQLKTLRIYKTLGELRDAWGGALVFCCGADAPGSGIVPAACIAGAAALLVAGDSYEVKKAFRRGEVDFVVNSLDEAVRALKNEVRQKRPLSVALVADVEATILEMVERGLQPDAFLSTGENADDVQPLIDYGMVQVRIGDVARQELVVHGEPHFEYFVEAATATKLREGDARLLRLMPKDEAVRRRWVEKASQYLRGASDGRWAFLSESEAGLLESEGFRLRSPE